MKSERFEELKEKVADFPVEPGVYLMKSEADKIIYVGKAKNLRARVRSYFGLGKDHSPKTRFLVSQIHNVEYLLTRTEVEAFLLEASLIKKHRPKYNIRLKDDKSYPYIKITWEQDFPKIILARKVKKDGGVYFGPFTSGGHVFSSIRFLNETFQIRDCADHVFRGRTRPCLSHQIGRCTAPCVNLVSPESYREQVQDARFFLEGKNAEILEKLEKQMLTAAQEEKFEVAAHLRDSIQAIQATLERQAVVQEGVDENQDVVGYKGDERGTALVTLHIRKGRVIGRRNYFFAGLNCESEQEDVRDWLVSFLNQYYEDNFIPDEVLIPEEIGRDLNKLLESVFFERASRQVIVTVPTDERRQALMDLALKNAEDQFASQVMKSEENDRALAEIAVKLNLPGPPKRMECFDISHFQGAETVASQVVFEDGLPAKEHYRRYKIKTVPGIDDFASMAEVIARRFQHQEWEHPDLIVIDGGRGQLNAACNVLESLGLSHLKIVGLAKSRSLRDFAKEEVEVTEERFFLPGRQNPVTFRPGSLAFQILTSLRDEAHRFAITFHRKLREQTQVASLLDEVPGLGDTRKEALLKRFGGINEIRQASDAELLEVKGMTLALIERLRSYLTDTGA